MLAYFLNIPARVKSRRDSRLTLGNALCGRLRWSLLDRSVPIWLSTSAKELIVEDGRVVGLVVEREGETKRLQARKGVLLAAGGLFTRFGTRRWGVAVQGQMPIWTLELMLDVRFGLFEMRESGGWKLKPR